MSAQDNMEKVLRELHVLLSKSNPYERDSNYLVVNKKEMLDVLKQLAVCMSEVMDEYELTKRSRDKAEREFRKQGDQIIPIFSDTVDKRMLILFCIVTGLVNLIFAKVHYFFHLVNNDTQLALIFNF